MRVLASACIFVPSDVCMCLVHAGSTPFSCMIGLRYMNVCLFFRMPKHFLSQLKVANVKRDCEISQAVTPTVVSELPDWF